MQYLCDKTDGPGGAFTLACTPTGVTPSPTPAPTPTPTPPPAQGFEYRDLPPVNTSGVISGEDGKTYAYPLPFAAVQGMIQLGRHTGTPDTMHVEICIAPTAGDMDYRESQPPPRGGSEPVTFNYVEGTPDSGMSIFWAQNGAPYAKVPAAGWFANMRFQGPNGNASCLVTIT